MTQTRQTLLAQFRTLSGNRYFLAGEPVDPSGIHVSFYDLDQIPDQLALATFLRTVDFQATDKGLLFTVVS